MIKISSLPLFSIASAVTALICPVEVSPGSASSVGLYRVYRAAGGCEEELSSQQHGQFLMDEEDLTTLLPAPTFYPLKHF